MQITLLTGGRPPGQTDEGVDVRFGFPGGYAIVMDDEDGELSKAREHCVSRQQNMLDDWRLA